MIRKKAKIMRKVKFPLQLDALDLVSAIPSFFALALIARSVTDCEAKFSLSIPLLVKC